MNVGMRPSQTNGLSIRNEVNFVPTLGEFKSEFGGDNATATVSGITSDPDFHAAGLLLFEQTPHIRWKWRGFDSDLWT